MLLVRVISTRFKKELPSRFNFNDVWLYYKKYYNSYQGSATKEEFEKNYLKYV